jgi:hypothetical protein
MHGEDARVAGLGDGHAHLDEHPSRHAASNLQAPTRVQDKQAFVGGGNLRNIQVAKGSVGAQVSGPGCQRICTYWRDRLSRQVDQEAPIPRSLLGHLASLGHRRFPEGLRLQSPLESPEGQRPLSPLESLQGQRLQPVPGCLDRQRGHLPHAGRHSLCLPGLLANLEVLGGLMARHLPQNLSSLALLEALVDLQVPVSLADQPARKDLRWRCPWDRTHRLRPLPASQLDPWAREYQQGPRQNGSRRRRSGAR